MRGRETKFRIKKELINSAPNFNPLKWNAVSISRRRKQKVRATDHTRDGMQSFSLGQPSAEPDALPTFFQTETLLICSASVCWVPTPCSGKWGDGPICLTEYPPEIRRYPKSPLLNFKE
jgi:hypothetical protein